MVSKNTTTALFLTINLVLFGFTVAQAPGPQAPTCPRDGDSLQACVNALGIINVILNIQTVRPCCTLVAGLGASVASACICDAVRVSIPGIANITVALQVLRLCRVSPPPGFTCA